MSAVSLPPPLLAFAPFDWVVLVVYAGLLLGIGFYFYQRQPSTNEEFFVGNRRTHPLLAGISIFTALTSIITYIGSPGEYVQNGPVLVFLANVITLPLIQIVVGWFLIPVFMRLPITSAYELLEKRLGLSVRRTGSMAYILTRLVWMALILYTTSHVMVYVTGCDPRWGTTIAVVVGLVTTTYTLFGGIRTVMVTEAIQFCLLVVGALLTIASITLKMGGIQAWWPSHWEPHWAPQPFFSLDPHVRVTVVGTFIYYTVATICVAGSDQSAVQRFLTTRDAAAARRAYLLNGIAVAIVAVILGLVGAALMGFYRVHPESVPAGVSFAHQGDAFFPLYISQFLPTGISGLVVASLLAASMSCLSAGINSLIAIITKDFIETSASYQPQTERQKMRQTRWLAIAIGVLVVLGTIAVGLVRGNILEVAGKTVNLLGSPLFGLFFLALFVPYSTPFGALIGAVYGITAAVLVGYWDVLTGLPSITFLWIAPLSLVASLGAGCLFSLWKTRRRSPAALAGYTAAALLPLAAGVALLLHSVH
ncbi:MAG: sodium-coupled permease [Opitutaceae bacterium]